MEFDPEDGGPDTRSDPLPGLVEFCAVEVETDADVTVTVEVTCTVVSETLPVLSPFPVPEDAPPGDNRAGVLPNEEGALKACVATKMDPAPARTSRTSTETTDNL